MDMRVRKFFQKRESVRDVRSMAINYREHSH